MNLHTRLETGRTSKPRRAFVYGTHGIGKSSFAASAPSPIFIPTEDGLGDIDCVRFSLMTDLDQVMDALADLYREEHDYETVVIDSVDWLERLILKAVCLERAVASIEDIGYGKGYTFALTHWLRVLAGLDALRNDRGMTVLLLAHSKIERFENPETETYDRYVPRLHRLASALLQEWSDEVLFATYKIFTKKTDEGFSRTRIHGIGTGERVLRTTERPAHLAKNRLGLPDELPLVWDAYASHFNFKEENKQDGISE